MSTSITLGYYNKRVNSTKCSGFTGTNYDCLLKEPCSINNPVFQLKGSLGNYNYLQWSSRYYWVDDTISFPNGIIEVHAHMDPLATYQSAIKSGHAFFTYGHKSYWNKDVDDIRMQPEKLEKLSGAWENVFNYTLTSTEGSVVMTVMEAAPSGHQGVATYALSVTQFEACLTELYNVFSTNQHSTASITSSIQNNATSLSTGDTAADFIGGGFITLIRDLEVFLSHIIADLGGLGGWRDNIIDIKFVPIKPANMPSSGSRTMYLGAIPTHSYPLVDIGYIDTKSDDFALAWSTKYTSDHRFLAYPRFHKFQVGCMGGYYQEIDPLVLRDNSGANAKLLYRSAIHPASGDWSAVVVLDSDADPLVLASFAGNCSVDITGLAGRGGMGSQMSTIMGAFRLAGNIFTASAANGAISGIMDEAGPSKAAAIGTGIATGYINNGYTGLASGVAGGGISSMFLSGALGKIGVKGVCYYPAMLDGTSAYTAYCDKYGYPMNKYDSFTNQWGSFVQCSGASIECEGNQQAQSYINSVCNSGIYLED